MGSVIQNHNYINIQGFMINELNLKGNELIIYACIYGFSQADNQTFKGSLNYLASWTNSTKQGVLNALKSLVAKDLLIKKETVNNGVKLVEYYTTKLNGVLNKVEWGGKQSLTGGIKQSLPNNIDNNNIEYNTQCVPQEGNNEEKIINELVKSTNLRENIKLWLVYKREKKSVYKKTGLITLLNIINKQAESNGEDYVIGSITNSISNNYLGIVYKTYNNNFNNNSKPKKEYRSGYFLNGDDNG